ncbi:MAG TPA: GldG family protein [bacterium]|jgi:gliding-associated putative ABC transporter substrate-binding component GldG
MQKAGQISSTTVEVIVVLGIVILVNILGGFYYGRMDLTKNKDFTLASSSKEVVSDLPDIVRITVYISKDLPPILQTYKQRTIDLLDEYRANGSSRLIIQYIDPDDLSEEEQQSINALGIQKQPWRIWEAEQQISVDRYFGIEISYGEKHEVIETVPMVANLEYEITSAVVKLISDELPTIAFLNGHGESTSENQFTTLATVLKELYSVRDIDLGTGRKIDDNVDTLIIAGPTQTIPERHQYVIDQFLMRGGKLVLMTSGAQLDQMAQQTQQMPQATFFMSPLNDLLTAYGIKVNNDLIADVDYNERIPVGNMGPIQITEAFPLFPRIVAGGGGFPSESPVTRGLDTTCSMPFTSSITFLFDKIKEGTEDIVLARSSEKSYSYPVPVSLDYKQTWLPPGGESQFKYQNAAVQLIGNFDSAFAGQPIPALLPQNEGGPATPDTDPMIQTTQVPTSITVFGNAQFIDDNWIQAQGNGVFFQNLIESLNLGEALIDIRSREIASNPLKPDMTTGEMNAYKFQGYILVPVLFTLFGVTRFYFKGQRKRLMQQYLSEQEKGKK